MSTSYDRLCKKCPDVGKYFPAEDVEDELTDAATDLNAAALGTRYSLACIYLAAHRLALRKRAEEAMAGAGPVVSPTGDTVGFGVPQQGPDGGGEATTPYGLEFRRIVRRCGPGMTSVW